VKPTWTQIKERLTFKDAVLHYNMVTRTHPN
jgi:hypothetical protein